jgi:carbon monoxide dehydrogenase subunit G
VEVTADAHGAAGAIRAQEDIDAPRQTVWDVLVDCARVGKLMVGVKSCRVLQSDPAGRWDIREQLTHAAVLPSARAVIRTDYDAPHTVAFHRIDGDFKILEGEWRLEPLDGGTRTRLFYQTRVTSPVPAPNLLVRSMLGANMTESLRKLRAASEAAARTQAANSPVKP